ncbi:MAG: C4-type zinc ribbon domain-containing protein [Bacteroidota bacterium]|jgi:predicted  nucleic acid-binding Zn-ribbon protein
MAKTSKKALKNEEQTLENPPIAEQKTQEEISIEKRLVSLFKLQQIDSKIDKIRIIRGELPLEVQDLEDQCMGLDTRLNKFLEEIKELEKQIQEKNLSIKDSKTLIKKYEEQQNNVRNNREYEALSKEVEFKNLEIQLFDKRIKEYSLDLELKKSEIENINKELTESKNELEIKKSELNDIISETEKEEQELILKSKEQQLNIEERLLTAYKRIRKGARNGLAVVKVERDACGGCFNKIPPQRILDIRMHKKIIVCEYCGRVLIDEEFADNI